MGEKIFNDLERQEMDTCVFSGMYCRSRLSDEEGNIYLLIIRTIIIMKSMAWNWITGLPISNSRTGEKAGLANAIFAPGIRSVSWV